MFGKKIVKKSKKIIKNRFCAKIAATLFLGDVGVVNSISCI